MSWLEFRLLHVGAYDSVKADLDRVAIGVDEAKFRLCDKCIEGLQAEQLARWHSSRLGKSILRSWSDDLLKTRASAASAGVATRLSRLALPILAMPDFQYSYRCSPALSPNLVVIGEDDGGFSALLAARVPWFDHMIAERFIHHRDPYSAISGGISIGRDDVSRITEALSEVMPSAEQPFMEEARQRLLDLCGRSLKSTDVRIVVNTRDLS